MQVRCVIPSCAAWVKSYDSQSIGALVAYPFTPYVNDMFGRRAAMFIGAVIMCGATALQAASSTVGMFIGARCVPQKLIK